MDPTSFASTFATIVGLLGLFKSERRAEETATIDQYLAWLRTHQHEQIADLIRDNAGLSHAIQKLMSHQHDEVMGKLQKLDQLMSEVASHLSDFRPIAVAMPAHHLLSDQAIHILRQLNDADASRLVQVRTEAESCVLDIQDGDEGQIHVTDQRFIDEDLLTLCKLGLLRLDSEGGYSRMYAITRAGAAVGG